MHLQEISVTEQILKLLLAVATPLSAIWDRIKRVFPPTLLSLSQTVLFREILNKIITIPHEYTADMERKAN
jgi:hypothetical protein